MYNIKEQDKVVPYQTWKALYLGLYAEHCILNKQHAELRKYAAALQSKMAVDMQVHHYRATKGGKDNYTGTGIKCTYNGESNV
jgi:hypothetical protein